MKIQRTNLRQGAGEGGGEQNSMQTPLNLWPDVMQIRAAVKVTLRSTGEKLREELSCCNNNFRLNEETISHRRAEVATMTTFVPHEAEEEEAKIKVIEGDIKIGQGRRWLFQNINHLSFATRSFCCFNISSSNNRLISKLTRIMLLLLLLTQHTTSGQLQHHQPFSQPLIDSNQPQVALQTPPLLFPQFATHLNPETPMNTQSSRMDEANLEAPQAMHRPYSHGPGLDLVALNRRRFELDHRHPSASSETDLRRGELIESYLAAMPDRILASLPENMDKQIVETLTADSSLLSNGGAILDTSSLVTDAAALGGVGDDPDGASIERLTKSCMTVHASSARPEQLNVTFHLYTKSNPHIAFIIRPQVTRQELIKSSPFDPNKPIKWITHGFHTNLDKSEWMVETKDKILAVEDSNVILTDWRRGASPALAFYPKAAANAHVVAKIIVKVLRRLRNDIDFSRIHLIGHSLGAHIMGFVGSAFTEEYLYEKQQLLMATNKRPFWTELVGGRGGGGDPQSAARGPGSVQLIGRITACDPALPCFGPTSSAPAANNNSAAGDLLFADSSDWTPSMWTHLRPDSAVIVEVMHSNPGVMGYAEPLGDYDFYPNGLERQPGCGSSHNQVEEGSRMVISSRRGKRQMFSMLGNYLFGTNNKQMSTSSSRNQEPSRFTTTIDRLIKPIRDFFQGYTCSHHRAVEYMVESMYYERVPQDLRLDRNFVCQMVGYRCQDYASFKRGFCFKCNHPLDCRAFTMPANSMPTSDWGQTQSLASQYSTTSSSSSARALKLPPSSHMDKFKVTSQRNSRFLSHDTRQSSLLARNSNSTQNHNSSSNPTKRVLPTSNQYRQNYQPQMKNQYFFDTRSTKDYCIHHYHLYVKYRWFRVRASVTLDGFQLSGSQANLTHLNGPTFNRFTYNSYTMLLTEPIFLGQIESLVFFGDKILPNYVDYIEVSYLSNLDPRVRALASGRLCKQDGNFVGASGIVGSVNSMVDFNSATTTTTTTTAKSHPLSSSRFVKCPLGGAVVV